MGQFQPGLFFDTVLDGTTEIDLDSTRGVGEETLGTALVVCREESYTRTSRRSQAKGWDAPLPSPFNAAADERSCAVPLL